jgi:hypothetical protein
MIVVPEDHLFLQPAVSLRPSRASGFRFSRMIPICDPEGICPWLGVLTQCETRTSDVHRFLLLKTPNTHAPLRRTVHCIAWFKPVSLARLILVRCRQDRAATGTIAPCWAADLAVIAQSVDEPTHDSGLGFHIAAHSSQTSLAWRAQSNSPGNGERAAILPT